MSGRTKEGKDEFANLIENAGGKMKKMQLLCLACAFIFALIFLTSIIWSPEEPEFICISTYGRVAEVMTPGLSTYTLDDLNNNAEEWRKLGYTSITYYNDEKTYSKNLVAQYFGVRDLRRDSSIVKEFDVYLHKYNAPKPETNWYLANLPSFRKVIAPSWALIFAIAFVILRRKQKV